jgi:hypothetical protein
MLSGWTSARSTNLTLHHAVNYTKSRFVSVAREGIFNLVEMGRIAKMKLKCRLYVCMYVLKHCFDSLVLFMFNFMLSQTAGGRTVWIRSKQSDCYQFYPGSQTCSFNHVGDVAVLLKWDVCVCFWVFPVFCCAHCAAEDDSFHISPF